MWIWLQIPTRHSEYYILGIILDPNSEKDIEETDYEVTLLQREQKQGQTINQTDKVAQQNKIKAVLDFQTFDILTTHTFINSWQTNISSYYIEILSVSQANTSVPVWSQQHYYLCSYISVYLLLQDFFLNSISQYTLLFLQQWCVPSTYPHTHASYISPVSPKLNFVSPKCQKTYVRELKYEATS